MHKTVLIVDDEEDIRKLSGDILKEIGYTVYYSSDGVSAIEQLATYSPNVVLLDIWLEGSEIDGLGVLEMIVSKYPNIAVVMMSGHGTVQTAVNALKRGAVEYLVKPFTAERLMHSVELANKHFFLRRENEELKDKVVPTPTIIGNSSFVTQLRSTIDKIAPTSSRVMIFGASGSGKELIAHNIHKQSNRSSERFVVYSPVRVSSERALIELFGQKPTHHNQERVIGALEKAHLGTLYIDEITNLSHEVQHMLLSFLRNQTISKLGDNRLTKLDVRIITSTSENVEKAINSGILLKDLYYRLKVVPIEVPPLSERKEDIAPLCEYYMEMIANKEGVMQMQIADDTMTLLQSYNWQGNVRQLESVIELCLVMHASTTHNTVLTVEMLPADIASSAISNESSEDNEDDIYDQDVDIMSLSLRQARETFEKQYLMVQMRRFGNNISKTSAFVGMERSALHRKLKALGITPDNGQTNNKKEIITEQVEEEALV